MCFYYDRQKITTKISQKIETCALRDHSVSKKIFTQQFDEEKYILYTFLLASLYAHLFLFLFNFRTLLNTTLKAYIIFSIEMNKIYSSSNQMSPSDLIFETD
jgi:hypothetical protein